MKFERIQEYIGTRMFFKDFKEICELEIKKELKNSSYKVEDHRQEIKEEFLENYSLEERKEIEELIEEWEEIIALADEKIDWDFVGGPVKFLEKVLAN